MIKRMLLILAGVGLAMQMTGCFFEGHDDRWHHDHDRDYDHHDHYEHHDDPGIDVHLHG